MVIKRARATTWLPFIYAFWGGGWVKLRGSEDEGMGNGMWLWLG